MIDPFLFVGYAIGAAVVLLGGVLAIGARLEKRRDD